MKNDLKHALIISFIVIVATLGVIFLYTPDEHSIATFHDKSITKIDEFLSTMQKSGQESLVFKKINKVDDNTLEYVMNIDLSLYDEYIFTTSAATKDASCYIIVKPKSQNNNTAFTQIEDYISEYADSWQEIDQDEYLLSHNYSKLTYGDYTLYIISYDNAYVSECLNGLFYYVDIQ